jgi:hypothetical protein
MELRPWKRRRDEERVLAEWREVVIPFDDLNQQQAIGIVDVWSCIKLLADAAASCPLIAYRRVGEQGRPRLTSGRLVELLARPAPAAIFAQVPPLNRRERHASAGLSVVELAGLEPATSWVRSRRQSSPPVAVRRR